MSAYYKTIALDAVDVERIRKALDEDARKHLLEGRHCQAAGCGDTHRRIVGQIREQQTPKERMTALRRELTGPTDDDS